MRSLDIDLPLVVLLEVAFFAFRAGEALFAAFVFLATGALRLVGFTRVPLVVDLPGEEGLMTASLEGFDSAQSLAPPIEGGAFDEFSEAFAVNIDL